MKHLTKFALSAIICLCAISSYAQPAQPSESFTPNKRFSYTGPLASSAMDRADPTNYTEIFSIPTLDRTGAFTEIGYIAVATSEVYTSADVNASSNDDILASWVGLPKVATTTATPLSGTGALPAAVASLSSRPFSDLTNSSTYHLIVKNTTP